ncbi:DDE-type integrase/transposase/recombinase [Streptomyces capitiformicae]|uniref:Integrase catalytic domain-containing protein n=1 Tax=Streptomyces capitiformicae TaxID=2014920 RepID=A0A919GHV0_9ACTN|nr:DDE-type integrase/transposase/recombinase [Streptomyces capitiformicae]GHH84711.1 hypothetical protein GCM10017771_14650 [Streptomyces capitiformicae]
MTGRTLAVDVGGVLYYEPFDLAWLQGIWELTRADDATLTMDAFLQAMRDFYQRRAPGSPPPSLFPPNGTKSWQSVRERWTSLVQPIPGAVDALSYLAEEYEVCIVANQPPECLAALREAGLAGISLRRSKGFTRRDPDADLAPDLVQRDFTAPAPNRLWVTDLTMIPTLEGPLWLSAIRDAFSRRVVAWETSARADADLVLTSLEYALASREVAPGELVHHADHDTQPGLNGSTQHRLPGPIGDVR